MPISQLMLPACRAAAMDRRELLQVLDEAVAHEHQTPRTRLPVRRQHRRPRRRPGRAGVIASREEGAGHHVSGVRIGRRFVLVRGWRGRRLVLRVRRARPAAIATVAASRQTDCTDLRFMLRLAEKKHERARARRARPKDQMRSGAAVRATNGGRMTRDRREAGPPEASANATPLGSAGPQTGQARSGAATSAARWVVQFRGRPETWSPEPGARNASCVAASE